MTNGVRPRTQHISGREEVLATIRHRLEAFARDALPDMPGRLETFARVGRVVDELVGHARSKGVDLIVLGALEDSLPKRFVWGSVARAVLNRAPCPVMLIPIRGAPATLTASR